MANDPFDIATQGMESGDFEVDLSESQSGLIPEGIFKAKVINVVKSMSKGNNPMWVWDFAIVCDEKGGTEFAGRQPRPEYTVLTANALWKLEELLLALGAVTAPGERFRGKREDLVGREVWIVIKQSEYNGRPQSNIDGYRSSIGNTVPGEAKAKTRNPANPFD